MSTLSSSSTFDQVVAAYADNCSYEEDSSVTKAKAFVTACRFLLVMMPVASEKDRAGKIEMNPTLIREQLEAAQVWIAAQPATGAAGGAKFLDLSSFRD